MISIKTTVEMPESMRQRVRELAQRSDLNFQQYVRRALGEAVAEGRIYSAPAPLLAAASFARRDGAIPGDHE
jgi:hypothetical protein